MRRWTATRCSSDVTYLRRKIVLARRGMFNHKAYPCNKDSTPRRRYRQQLDIFCPDGSRFSTHARFFESNRLDSFIVRGKYIYTRHTFLPFRFFTSFSPSLTLGDIFQHSFREIIANSHHRQYGHRTPHNDQWYQRPRQWRQSRCCEAGFGTHVEGRCNYGRCQR